MLDQVVRVGLAQALVLDVVPGLPLLGVVVDPQLRRRPQAGRRRAARPPWRGRRGSTSVRRGRSGRRGARARPCGRRPCRSCRGSARPGPLRAGRCRSPSPREPWGTRPPCWAARRARRHPWSGRPPAGHAARWRPGPARGCTRCGGPRSPPGTRPPRRRARRRTSRSGSPPSPPGRRPRRSARRARSTSRGSAGCPRRLRRPATRHGTPPSWPGPPDTFAHSISKPRSLSRSSPASFTATWMAGSPTTSLVLAETVVGSVASGAPLAAGVAAASEHAASVATRRAAATAERGRERMVEPFDGMAELSCAGRGSTAGGRVPGASGGGDGLGSATGLTGTAGRRVDDEAPQRCAVGAVGHATRGHGAGPCQCGSGVTTVTGEVSR